MTYAYTTIDGQRVQVSVAAAFERLAAEFKRVWGLEMYVTSGTRTRAEQQALYNAYLNGGTLAAAPGYSNHEEYGPTGPRALDVRDSGKDAGVTIYGTPRANWLRSNASRYGFSPTGYGFSQVEPWHIEYAGDLDNNVNETVVPEEDEMILIESLPDRGRAVIGAGYFRKLRNSEELSQATKIVSRTVRGNARQFDVWKAIALQGSTPTVDVTVDASDIVDQLVAADIAEAVADELAKRLSG